MGAVQKPLPLINFSTQVNPNDNVPTVANYNLKDYEYDEETKTYKRKTNKNKKPIPNTTVIIEEMRDKDKKFNYNPRR